MEVVFGPNSVDEPNLLYKLQRKIKVFNTTDPLPNRGYNLVACASKYGIVFTASPDGHLSVYYLQQLIDKDCEPQHTTVKLQEKPTHIAASCDQELLAVTGGQLLTIYKIADFQNQNTGSIKPRVINVASHCGLQPLPGFGAYSASKAGVLALTKALRMEQRRHGLSAVAFVPGGFVTSSNLVASQGAHGNTMLEHLNDEQKSFYGKRITTLTNYLQSTGTAHNAEYDSLKDENIIETFVKALTDDNPKDLYKVESWRYMFYYNLFKLPLPEATLGWLVKKFLTFPE